MGQFENSVKQAAVPILTLATLAFGAEATATKGGQAPSDSSSAPAERILSAEELAVTDISLERCTFVPPVAPSWCGTKLHIPDDIAREVIKERPQPQAEPEEAP